jgi:DNA-binding GntR family transcriptional regulator
MNDPDAIFRVQKVAAPLRRSVTESIRTAIALGRLKAGERLPERELCEPATRRSALACAC